jgi:ATP-dependent Lon protease
VTILTALASLLTCRPIKSDVAMTGEVTLRGAVLPVGGIKEKVLAASRNGIKHVILPERNKNDLEEIPENIQRLFVAAHDISAEWHVRMQAALQCFVDNSLSKT